VVVSSFAGSLAAHTTLNACIKFICKNIRTCLILIVLIEHKLVKNVLKLQAKGTLPIIVRIHLYAFIMKHTESLKFAPQG
jgi:hypothetical protein